MKFFHGQFFSLNKLVLQRVQSQLFLPPRSIVKIANLEILNMPTVHVRQANRKLKLCGHWRICKGKKNMLQNVGSIFLLLFELAIVHKLN